MKILALEFSSAQRSVAVACDAVHVREVIETTPGNTMRPFAMAETALEQAGLEREAIDRLVVGLGPGSYTGIRAGIALAQGWQLARSVRAIGISSAEAMAAGAQADGLRGRLNIVIDAQRGEFYLTTWELSENGRRELEPLHIVKRDAVQARLDAGEPVAGPHVTKHFPGGLNRFPRAATLAQLALSHRDGGEAAGLEPIYLRETTFVKAPAPRVI